MPLTQQDSLYEHLYPLTTVMKQSFVANFSRHSLDTKRWHYADINGSNTGAMSDSVNGGYSITTAGADSNSAMISFNDIRQYDPTGNVSISVWKKDVELSAGLGGLVSVDSAIHPTLECAVTRNGSTSAKIALLTGDASSTSATDSSIDDDTAFHVFKIECTSPNIQQTIDGVLETTKTTNRPTVKLQPFFGVQFRGLSGTAVFNLTYCEAYNT
jgi:hypothetical protein